MAEALSPNRKRRLPITSSLIQSPKSPFFIGSNDDNLERKQARAAAKAAAIRRKNLVAPPLVVEDPELGLGKHQILDLFQNCIKLASENCLSNGMCYILRIASIPLAKINQKNTWELNLIDHLCDIIKVEEENDVETNFQKASCTLEAGVKIYSLRVDSVHSEAYKVLGGINRVGLEDEQELTMGDGNVDGEQEEGQSKKETDRKISPLSTLEASLESLNVKKFDVAFSVDPLYHQTSKQFDEGGAKGLLLNNLGVYGGCRVLFDSSEIPGREMSNANEHNTSEKIDLSFAREYFDQMELSMQMKNEISPTLVYIVNQFDENNRRPSGTFSNGQQSEDHVDNIYDNEVDGDTFGNCGNDDFDNDDEPSFVEDDFHGAQQTSPSYHEETEQFPSDNLDNDDRFDNVDEILLLSLGLSSKKNAWAGPDHWKYQKAKGSEDILVSEEGEQIVAKKPRHKKKIEADIDFSKALDIEVADIFAPPKNPKTLLLPANRAPNTKLPEDCHYQPEDLVKLFLLPNVMCLGKRRRKPSDELRQQYNDSEQFQSWGDDNGFDGQYGDDNDHSDVEDSNTLVSQPRQVNKIEVQYDKTSKQVDVQALKETLWGHIQESPHVSTQILTSFPPLSQHKVEEAISFKEMLATFPSDCQAAPTIKDISPHLCFICLLHLANEHGLSIHGCTNLDDLSICLPSKDQSC
ncbi:hypothetical protein ACFE04_029300 [Oxalis oulophora]